MDLVVLLLLELGCFFGFLLLSVLLLERAIAVPILMSSFSVVATGIFGVIDSIGDDTSEGKSEVKKTEEEVEKIDPEVKEIEEDSLN